MAKKSHSLSNSIFFNGLMKIGYPVYSLFSSLGRLFDRVIKLKYSKFQFIKINRKAPQSSCSLNNFIDPSAKIEFSSKAIIKIGSNVNIDKHCLIKVFGDGELLIGDNTYLGPHTHLYVGNRISIGNDCIIAPFCFFIDHDHVFKNGSDLSFDHTPRRSDHEVKIGNNVWLGTKAIVTKGVTIGDRSIIGAGTVVTKNTETDSVLVGSPSRQIK